MPNDKGERVTERTTQVERVWQVVCDCGAVVADRSEFALMAKCPDCGHPLSVLERIEVVPATALETETRRRKEAEELRDQKFEALQREAKWRLDAEDELERLREGLREIADWCEDKSRMAREEREHRPTTDDRYHYCDGQVIAWGAAADKARSLASSTPKGEN